MSNSNPIQKFVDTHSVCELSEALKISKLNTVSPDHLAASKFWDAIFGVCAFGSFNCTQKNEYVSAVARIATAWDTMWNKEYPIFPDEDVWKHLLGLFNNVREKGGDGEHNAMAARAVADAIEDYTMSALREIGVMAKAPAALDDIVISTIGSAGTVADLMDKPKEAVQPDRIQPVPGSEITYRTPALAHMRRETERRTQSEPQTDKGTTGMAQENRDTAFGRACRLLEDLPRDANKFESALIECLNRTTFDMDVFDHIDRVITSALCGIPALDHALDGYNPWTVPERFDLQKLGIFAPAVQNIGPDGLPMFIRKSIGRPNNWCMEEIAACLQAQIAGVASRIAGLQLPRHVVCQIREMLTAIDYDVSEKLPAHSMLELKTFFIIERLLELTNVSMYVQGHTKLMIQAIEVVYRAYTELKLRSQPYNFNDGRFYGGYPSQPQMGFSAPESLCGMSTNTELGAAINEIYRHTGRYPVGLVYTPHSKQALRIVMLGTPGAVEAFIQEPPLAQRRR